MINNKKSVAVTLAAFVSFLVVTPAPASEIDELKATIQSMQKSMEQMQTRITELEQENHKQKKQAATSRTAPPPAAVGAPAAAPTSVGESGNNQVVTIAPTAVTIEGRASQIKDRPAMDDQREAAPRPPSPSPLPSVNGPTLRLTMHELARHYERDDLAADRDLTGAAVEITGAVQDCRGAAAQKVSQAIIRDGFTDDYGPTLRRHLRMGVSDVEA